MVFKGRLDAQITRSIRSLEPGRMFPYKELQQGRLLLTQPLPHVTSTRTPSTMQEWACISLVSPLPHGCVHGGSPNRKITSRQRAM